MPAQRAWTHDDPAHAAPSELDVRRLSMKYTGFNAPEILRAAITDDFAGRIALVSSFGAEAAALLHLVSEVDKSVPVIFLDTGKHFSQTLSYRKKLTNHLGLKDVRVIGPATQAVEQRDSEGDLWQHDADACCALRKVEPLNNALAPFDAWITGRKQFHGGGRIKLPVFEANSSHFKVNPLARWTKDDVADHMRANDIPSHPLVEQGFASIGCWPCTRPVGTTNNVRAGRWVGATKSECGIHAE